MLLLVVVAVVVLYGCASFWWWCLSLFVCLGKVIAGLLTTMVRYSSLSFTSDRSS